ncbi:MAG: MerR family transcriptional regulator [Bacteroidota bacterium]
MPKNRKLYYSISEVSELTQLAPHVLRYWESEFVQLRPKKSPAGNRRYTESDIETVRQIKHLLREQKYTLDGARQALETAEVPLPVEELLELRAFLSKVLEKL